MFEASREKQCLTFDEFYDLAMLAQASAGTKEYRDAAKSVSNADDEVLDQIWSILRETPFQQFRAGMGLTQAQFARRFVLKKRTVENWESGARDCPLHIRIFIADSLGLLPERRA